MRLEDDWVPMVEQIDPEDLVEVIRTKEAHSRAVVLESVCILQHFFFLLIKPYVGAVQLGLD